MFQNTLRQTTRKIGRNTLAIWTTAPSQSLLNAVKVVALEKGSSSDTQNSKAFGYHIDSQWQGVSA